jgi:hypothetical protein
MQSFPDWVPTVAAWVGAVVSAGFSLYQWKRAFGRDIQKELNARRLELYPEVQKFVSNCYVVGWQDAMKFDGRINELVGISNKLLLWASDDTLRAWSAIVNKGQRGQLSEVKDLAAAWVTLDLCMRRDLGYGSKLRAKDIYPALFAPRVVDNILAKSPRPPERADA